MKMDITNLKLKDAAEKIAKKEISCKEYTDELIKQTEKYEHLNAWTYFDKINLRKKAAEYDDNKHSRGLLGGIPIGVKDNINTKDMPTTGGTKGLFGKKPPENAEVINLMLKQGAIIAGKTNMHELSLGITCNNRATGSVRNPWNERMIAGGSSGGSAVAVATGMVPVALGTDTGGSVRLPASLCGVFGFRPTTGRYSSKGILKLTDTKDTVGIFAKNSEDIIYVDSLLKKNNNNIYEKKFHQKIIRVGIAKEYYNENIESDILKIFDHAVKILIRNGITFIECNDLSAIKSINSNCSMNIVKYEMKEKLRRYIKDCKYELSAQDVIDKIYSQDVMKLFSNENTISDEEYLIALQKRAQLKKIYKDIFKQNNLDVIVFPTSQLAAKPIGDDEMVYSNEKLIPTFMSFISNTDPSSTAGIPSISIPIGFTSDGLPVGMEIDGIANNDDNLLEISSIFEKLLKY